MMQQRIVSQEEWLAARKAHLRNEKALARMRDLRSPRVGRGHDHGRGRVLRDEPARCLQAYQGARARRPEPNVMEHRGVSREEWLARGCSAK
jgi:hypothetical protein